MPPEELERLESLTSRFARLADLLIQRIFRLIDEIELTGTGTLLDRIYRAEKRGWVEASEMIKIRELRNLIAHEYANDKMPEIYAVVAAMSPALLANKAEVFTPSQNRVNDQGRIHVVDAEPAGVKVFDSLGKYVLSYGTELRQPNGIAIDQKRRLIFISDTALHAIAVYKY